MGEGSEVSNKLTPCMGLEVWGCRRPPCVGVEVDRQEERQRAEVGVALRREFFRLKKFS